MIHVLEAVARRATCEGLRVSVYNPRPPTSSQRACRARTACAASVAPISRADGSNSFLLECCSRWFSVCA